LVSARFFVDKNDLALGKELAGKRGDIVFPGHSSLPEVPRGSLDEEWLPAVGAHALVVITRDRRIRYRPVEKQLWLEYHVRGFVLTGRRSQSTSDSLAVLEKHWSRIEHLVVAQPNGPWMYSVTLERLRKISLF
jgi:hypothetical protein